MATATRFAAHLRVTFPRAATAAGATRGRLAAAPTAVLPSPTQSAASAPPALAPAASALPVAPQHADFHYAWLKLFCADSAHPLTNERQRRPLDVPMNLHATQAQLVDGDQTLQVVWSDGTESLFSMAWLQQHQYSHLRGSVVAEAVATARAAAAARSAVPSGSPSAVAADCHDPEAPFPEPLRIQPAQSVAEAIEHVKEHGIAIVHRYPVDDPEALIQDFEASGFRLWPSHFGRFEDLRTDNTTNANTDQLGYTTAAVHLHTDMPFMDVVPGFQVLHCIRTADTGGENYVADAVAAANYLRRTDRHSFDILSNVPVHLSRHQAKFVAETRYPMLQLNDDGEVVQVRSSYFTLAPTMLPFDEMMDFLRAYATYEHILHTPEFRHKLALNAGDFLVYDNLRMLHAREAFSGPRWMRGFYFEPIAKAAERAAAMQ